MYEIIKAINMHYFSITMGGSYHKWEDNCPMHVILSGYQRQVTITKSSIIKIEKSVLYPMFSNGERFWFRWANDQLLTQQY